MSLRIVCSHLNKIIKPLVCRHRLSIIKLSLPVIQNRHRRSLFTTPVMVPMTAMGYGVVSAAVGAAVTKFCTNGDDDNLATSVGVIGLLAGGLYGWSKAQVGTEANQVSKAKEILNSWLENESIFSNLNHMMDTHFSSSTIPNVDTFLFLKNEKKKLENAKLIFQEAKLENELKEAQVAIDKINKCLNTIRNSPKFEIQLVISHQTGIKSAVDRNASANELNAVANTINAFANTVNTSNCK